MPETNPLTNKHDLAAAAGIRTFDTALPQPWLDHVRALTGEYPLAGFVWSYDPPFTVVGRPAPLTESATALLARLPEFLGGPLPNDQFPSDLPLAAAP